MDLQDFFLMGLSLACSVLGWFGRELWSAVSALKSDLKELTKEINEKYVRKDDFRDFKTELMNVLNRIEQKLDNKADK